MFNFLRRTTVQSPSIAIRRAMQGDGIPPGLDASTLGQLESRGTYAGRKVTYFLIFDPSVTAARGVDVFARHAYRKLEAHPELVLRSGFTERDGSVIMYQRSAAENTAGSGGAEQAPF